MTGQRYKASEFRKDILRFLEGCKKNGLLFQEGDVVAICSENSYNFAVVYYGVLFQNATAAPLNHSYTSGKFFLTFPFSRNFFIFAMIF